MKIKRAFTLVELLVVISIIALLLSILIPSLQAARRQAKELICKTQLRQIGMGLHVYAESNKDKWPDQAGDSAVGQLVPNGGDSWCRKLSTMLNDESLLFYCPIARTDEIGVGASWTKQQERYTVSYLYNGAALMFKRSEFDRASEKIIAHDLGWKHLDAFLRTSSVEAIWANPAWNEGYADYPWAWYSLQYPNPTACNKALNNPTNATWNIHWHSKQVAGRNLLMMDGHVEWHKWGTFTDSYLPSKELKKINYRHP